MKVLLAMEIAALYVRARRALGRADLPTALAAMRQGDGRAVSCEPERLARAVSRTLPLLPGETRCLMRSLVLTGLLARRGIEGVVVIGVRPAGPFGAHAWVELGGRPLLPPGEERFERLVEL